MPLPQPKGNETQPHFSPLRVCILTSQYFGPRKFGGFGTMARTLAEALAGRGIPTSVIVPRRGPEPLEEKRGGVEIRRFPPFSLAKAWRLLRTSSATVFHSQDPTLLTFLAVRARPGGTHVVTCRDPREWSDWLVEFRHATWDRRLRMPRNWFLEVGPLVRWGVRRADGVYVTTPALRPKAQRVFSPRVSIGVLPNLVAPPVRPPRKAARPVLTFVGRLDPRKRPELFLDLSSRFPGAEFQVVGRAESPRREADLRRRYEGLPNVRWEGFVDRFEEPGRMARLLARSWILVNTSLREGLPLSFLEAAVHECALVSAVNPEDFAVRFGRQVEGDDFEGAVRGLLSNRSELVSRAKAARDYVLSVHGRERALNLHLEAYRRSLEHRPERARR